MQLYSEPHTKPFTWITISATVFLSSNKYKTSGAQKDGHSNNHYLHSKGLAMLFVCP